MAITHFRISKLPSIVNVLKNAAPVVVNTSYLLIEENQISFSNTSGFKGEFLDEMEMQVSEDNVVWTSPEIIKIKELVLTKTPGSANENLDATKNTSYSIYSLLKIPINTSTDRIMVQSIVGNFTLNGIPLSIGTVVYMHQLPNIMANVDNGSGTPYMSLEYYCGNHLGFNFTTSYLFQVNVISLAEIASINQSGVNPLFETLNITNGLSNKTATVEIITSGNMFSSGPGSEVVVSIPGSNINITANGTQIINFPLDNEGVANIEVQHNYTNFGVPATSNVQLTILAIDGNGANVSVNDNYTSTANYI